MKARTWAFLGLLSVAVLWSAVYGLVYWVLSKWAKPVEFNIDSFQPEVSPGPRCAP